MKKLITILFAAMLAGCYTTDKATGEKWRYGAIRKDTKNGIYYQYRVSKSGKKERRECNYHWGKWSYSLTK